MKKILLILYFALFTCGQNVLAQTDYEIEESAIDSERDMLKKKIGKGGKDKIVSLRNEAKTGSTPCTIFDDNDWFTAFNQKEGFPGDPKLANSLLRECQFQLKSKLGGRVQQVLREYSDQMDTEDGSYAREHFEALGEMVVDKEIGDTEEYCREETEVDPQTGRITMYMAIRISKKATLSSLIKNCVNTNDNKQGNDNVKNREETVRQKEKLFRELTEKYFEME